MRITPHNSRGRAIAPAIHLGADRQTAADPGNDSALIERLELRQHAGSSRRQEAFRRSQFLSKPVNDAFLRQRSPRLLLFVALVVGLIYVSITFDSRFLAGHGQFWAYPVGPWLGDSNDVSDNVDILDYLIAYTGLVKSSWGLPLFHVAAIGAPTGTSVVFLDVIPIAALIGRIASNLFGVFLLPYGAWVGTCFILSPIFATLMVAERGHRSMLAAVAASVLAVSPPILLHRFGHLPLQAHFLIIGAFYLYFLEQRPLRPSLRFAFWSCWLVLGLLTNPYMFAMVSAIYAAGLTRSWRENGFKARLFEPALIGVIVLFLLFELGFIGSGAALSGEGYGYYSMNLLSPFIPQRSGLFPSMDRIIDGTGGQYEGFSYLGFGGLILLVIALLIDPPGLRSAFIAHRELAVILLILTLFAVSNNIWLGDKQISHVSINWRLAQLAGIYRSSGRMFFPAYYMLLLGSLLFVLHRVGRSWRLPLIGACCVLQLLDTEPFRARMTSLTSHGGTPLLDQTEWADRIAGSDFVEIYPTFFCSDAHQQLADMELQVLAITAGKSFNVAYNPRLHSDCAAEARGALAGPWRSTTLYVFLAGTRDVPKDWTPAGLSCATFREGKWCLGRQQADRDSSSPGLTR